MKSPSPNPKPAATLRVYAIPDAFRDLLENQNSVDEDGVLSSEGLEKLDELLHSAKESILDLSCYVKECEASAQVIRELANTSLERARRLDLRVSKYKQYLLKALEATGHAKLSDPRISIAIQNNPASVHIDDERNLPPNPEYWRIHKEPDRCKIKELLKEGREIPGCSLLHTQRVSIK